MKPSERQPRPWASPVGRPRLYASNSERTAAWKKANPERARQHSRASVRRWKQRNPERAAESARYSSLASYGLTADEHAAMEYDQGGKCAICRQEDTKRLAIDHDHATGKVRGLLCRKCNLSLGLMGDDAVRLARAALYLIGELPREVPE